MMKNINEIPMNYHRFQTANVAQKKTSHKLNFYQTKNRFEIAAKKRFITFVLSSGAHITRKFQ